MLVASYHLQAQGKKAYDLHSPTTADGERFTERP